MTAKKKRRQFTKEFKVEAAKMVVDQGIIQAQVARNLGIGENLLGRWVADYRAAPQTAFPGKGNLRPDDERLRQLEQQVKRLTMERDVLKKAVAYFAEIPN